MKPTTSRRGAAPAVVALLPFLALSCSSSGDAAEPAKPGPRAAPSSWAAAPPGPAALKSTLPLGAGLKGTVFGYRQPLASKVSPRRSGFVYAGLDVKVCVEQATAPVEVSWAGWQLSYDDSTTAEPVNSWSDDWFSVPVFPGDGFGKTIRAGGCVRGWIVLEVRAGAKPTTADYVPGSSAVRSVWRL
ncbi:hypothetical protein [Spirillospora sp. CA-294931]|uniref:hypothetical protein n=1 Tax=Spirillospora sp. CA-294931 TaxID=3240042 RepID=UPI003D945824